MKTFEKILGLCVVMVGSAFAQTTTAQTTLSAAMASTDPIANVTSATGITALGTSNLVNSFLFIDRELMRVTAVNGTVLSVSRGAEGTPATGHNNGATIYVGPANNFAFQDPSGSCVSTSQINLPRPSVISGRVWNCTAAGVWQQVQSPFPFSNTDGYFYVPPSACAFNSTGTLAASGQGMTVAGASFTPVLQVSTTAAGASVNTLNCYVALPTRLTSGKGITISDVTVMYGAQTTALTSISGAAVSTIAFPVAAATETVSTVTPVAIAGAITQSTTTGNLGVTTAGAFATSKLTLGTPLNVTTDLQALIVTELFNQSASAAQIVNTPGLIVHYTQVIE